MNIHNTINLKYLSQGHFGYIVAVLLREYCLLPVDVYSGSAVITFQILSIGRQAKTV